ncbi:MAG: MMPL family transporter [Candidatus Polarisedimenticolia bacterium]
MLQRVVSAILDWILDHAGTTVAVSALVVIVALVAGSRVEFRTSRSDLSPPDDPEERLFVELTRGFASSSAVIVAIEAQPGRRVPQSRLRGFADDLSAALQADPRIARVLHRVDLTWFSRHGLFLIPPETLDTALEAASSHRDFIDALSSLTGLADLNDLIARRLESELTSPMAAGASAVSGAEAAQGAAGLRWFAEAQGRFLREPAAAVISLESAPALLALTRLGGEDTRLAAQGYLSTRDGTVLYLLATPASEDDSLPALEGLMASLREHAERVGARYPEAAVSFTGEPAITVEEMRIVGKDMWLTSGVSAAGVVLLMLTVFRWRAHALLALASLGAGVAWAYGAVLLELGYLNLIASSFISTLVGVSDAYSIHPVSEYELEGAHLRDPREAVRRAYAHTGAAVVVGAITTAAAFFSIMLMNFRGFSEMGLVAGVGLILCLVSALVTLPALLLLYGRWRAARDARSEALHRADQRMALVDRLWVEQAAGFVCAAPRTVTALALAVTAILAWLGSGVKFDPDIMALMPGDASTIQQQRRLLDQSDLSPTFTLAVAADLAELDALRRRAASEPSIARVESALDLLPADPDAARRAASHAGPVLETLLLPGDPAPVDRAALVTSLARLRDALESAGEASFGAGMAEAAAAFETARASAEEAHAFVEGAPPGAERVWQSGTRGLLDWARRLLNDLRANAASVPPRVDDLPQELRDHFVTADGRLLAYLHPAGDVFDAGFLAGFVDACRRVSRDTTGFPILFHRMSERITSGFVRAVAAGGIAVCVLLFLDYRDLRHTLLALVPLVMGILWMLGFMRLLGISYNFANLVAVPLIIGVGIDNGVHVVHRIRFEGRGGMTLVLKHTGRAILIAGLTTMIGFGSLALASHRGLASLGLTLLLGVGACIVTALVVLPNMLIAFRQAQR